MKSFAVKKESQQESKGNVMRLTIKKKTARGAKARIKKRLRIRKRVQGTADRPRLCVFKSSKNIYAQLIDDVSGKTLVSASTLQDKVKASGRDAAGQIGKMIAERAKEKNVEAVVFDRSGYLYHGRIKALADGARESGLKF